MNHLTPKSIARTSIAVCVGLLAAASAMAETATARPTATISADASYDTYQRTVLGNESAVAAPPATLPTAYLQPGPYAGHLIYLGVDPRSAIAQARAIGERPTLQPASPTPANESGLDAYERVVLGQETAPGSERRAVR